MLPNEDIFQNSLAVGIVNTEKRKTFRHWSKSMARFIFIICFVSVASSFKIATPCVRLYNIRTVSQCALTGFTCQQSISDLPASSRRVKAIVSDVDGTLFNSQHQLGPDTRLALISAMDRGIPIIMATGKSRGPWVKQLRESLGMRGDGWNINGPSVFIQGLMVCDDRDRIVFSRLLNAEMIREMDQFAADRGITVIAYTTDDRIVARQVHPRFDNLFMLSMFRGNSMLENAIAQCYLDIFHIAK